MVLRVRLAETLVVDCFVSLAVYTMTAGPSNIRAYAVALRHEDMPPSKETSNPCSNTLRPRRRHTDLRQPCAGSVREDTAEQTAPTVALAPPLPRNHQVLPSPSEARAHHDRQTRAAPSTDLGACDPPGTRRDTRRPSSTHAIPIEPVGGRRDLRDRPQPSQLAIPCRRLPRRHRLLVWHLGLVESERARCSSVRGGRSGSSVDTGSRRSMGTRSLRPLGLSVSRGRLVRA